MNLCNTNLRKFSVILATATGRQGNTVEAQRSRDVGGGEVVTGEVLDCRDLEGGNKEREKPVMDLLS
jgi:hypothetical protein